MARYSVAGMAKRARSKVPCAPGVAPVRISTTLLHASPRKGLRIHGTWTLNQQIPVWQHPAITTRNRSHNRTGQSPWMLSPRHLCFCVCVRQPCVETGGFQCGRALTCTDAARASSRSRQQQLPPRVDVPQATTAFPTPNPTECLRCNPPAEDPDFHPIMLGFIRLHPSILPERWYFSPARKWHYGQLSNPFRQEARNDNFWHRPSRSGMAIPCAVPVSLSQPVPAPYPAWTPRVWLPPK